MAITKGSVECYALRSGHSGLVLVSDQELQFTSDFVHFGERGSRFKKVYMLQIKFETSKRLLSKD